MLRQWRLLTTPPAHGAWNMAVDEAILEHVGRGGRAQHLALLHLEAFRDSQAAQVFADDRAGLPRTIDKINHLCAAAESFNAHRAHAGKPIEKDRILNRRPQDVEQCFPQFVARRADAFRGLPLELTASKNPSDDAHHPTVTSPAGVIELARKAGHPLPADDPMALYHYDSLDSFLAIFWLVQETLIDPGDWARIAYESLVDGAAHGLRREHRIAHHRALCDFQQQRSWWYAVILESA